MSVLKKFLLPLICLVVLGYVISQVEPPESPSSASVTQLLALFLPLLLFLMFSINLYFKHPLKSLGISAGVTLLLILQTLSMLNILSGGAIIAVVTFLIKSFKNPKNDYQPKIPKLMPLSKQ